MFLRAAHDVAAANMTTHGVSDALLLALPEATWDQLFPLREGGAVVESLTGRSPDSSAIHRWASRGIAGEKLKTITVGRRRFTTRRWLLDWFAAVDHAHREAHERRSRCATQLDGQP